MNIAEAIPPLVRLNAWARSPYEALLDMSSAAQAVYTMKRKVILAAIDGGQCAIRIVSVERPCKTCRGTGQYEGHNNYDYDDTWYDDCRRCSATGKVILKFAETEILGARFHNPQNKADFLRPLNLDWDKCESTDWTPEQPGRALSRWEVIVALNELERAIFWPRRIRYQPNYYMQVMSYPLNFGRISDCFVCGRFHAGPGEFDRRMYSEVYGQKIHRPAMNWTQCICRDCERKADRWPRQWPATLQNPRHDRGMWISESPAWPMNAPLHPWAETEVVREWLARRGIAIGEIPPSDYGWRRDTGEMVEVIGHAGGRSQVKFVSDSFRYGAQEIIPTRLLSGFPIRRLTA